jgi:uncharacterized protein DUF1320
VGDYITLDNIVKAISPTTVLALCDDDNIGDINAPEILEVVEEVIARAEAEVNSYLMRAYPLLTFPVVQSPLSVMLKQAALQFAIPFLYMRHPEYVRTYGDEPRGGVNALDNARAFMERVCTGQQYLFDVPSEPKPATVGGVWFAYGPRTIIDGPNGQINGGDF